MQVSEILRQIADVISADEAREAEEQVLSNAAQAAQVVHAAQHAQPAAAPAPETACGQTDARTPEEVDGSATMVSPLQQEHELLKKATGVDNNVDTFAAEDELDDMRNLAGIGEEPNAPVDHAGDCKPVSMNPRAVAATEANHGTPDKRLQQTQRRKS